MMKSRTLGRTGTAISPLGIGTWAMGSGKGGSAGLGFVNDNESLAAIQCALDLGMNWIDTAPYYGFGHAETIVARALRTRTQRPYIFTKCGLPSTEHGVQAHEFRLKAWSIRAEIEASLRRLETDVLDLVMLHWPIPDEDVEEGWTTLVELQEEGKVRFLGVSNFSVEQMERCARIAPVDVAQPEYSLINRIIEHEILPYAQAQNVGVLAYAPLKHGILSGGMTRDRVAELVEGDWRHGHSEYTEPRLSRNLAIVDTVQRIAERHGVSSAEISVAWTLSGNAVTAAIVGARKSAQFARIVGAADIALSAEDLAELDRSSARER